MAEESLDFNIEQLPFSLEAEQSVLGAILIEPECISAEFWSCLFRKVFLTVRSISSCFPSCWECLLQLNRLTLSPFWKKPRHEAESLQATEMLRSI